MSRPKMTAKVLGSGDWPDSRAERRAFWLSRPPAQRVAAGRELHKNICRWFHLKGLPPAIAVRAIKPLR